ncbi:hypothetical protein PR048_003532 [Dryococelus australis]|uniref:Uncharacterized protein n=1 Tax=Dryococelus australis TaxID=614101 RepID=A0ABQ9INE4_9NEOP|nr:hypothetical protein PR048_003532 [Dryococelus australis]
MPISTVHWLSAVTVEGDDWAIVLHDVPNTVGGTATCGVSSSHTHANKKVPVDSKMSERRFPISTRRRMQGWKKGEDSRENPSSKWILLHLIRGTDIRWFEVRTPLDYLAKNLQAVRYCQYSIVLYRLFTRERGLHEDVTRAEVGSGSHPVATSLPCGGWARWRRDARAPGGPGREASPAVRRGSVESANVRLAQLHRDLPELRTHPACLPRVRRRAPTTFNRASLMCCEALSSFCHAGTTVHGKEQNTRVKLRDTWNYFPSIVTNFTGRMSLNVPVTNFTGRMSLNVPVTNFTGRMSLNVPVTNFTGRMSLNVPVTNFTGRMSLNVPVTNFTGRMSLNVPVTNFTGRMSLNVPVTNFTGRMSLNVPVTNFTGRMSLNVPVTNFTGRMSLNVPVTNFTGRMSLNVPVTNFTGRMSLNVPSFTLRTKIGSTSGRRQHTQANTDRWRLQQGNSNHSCHFVQQTIRRVVLLYVSNTPCVKKDWGGWACSRQQIWTLITPALLQADRLFCHGGLGDAVDMESCSRRKMAVTGSSLSRKFRAPSTVLLTQRGFTTRCGGGGFQPPSCWKEKKRHGKGSGSVQKWGHGFNECYRQNGISKPTLNRHLDCKNVIAYDVTKALEQFTILPFEIENTLVEHILKLEELLSGVTIHDVCKLAYHIAEHNHIPHCTVVHGSLYRDVSEVNEEIWTALNIEVMRAIGVSMERRGNEGAGSPRKPTDQRHRPVRFLRSKIRSDPAGESDPDRLGWGASRLTAQPPWPLPCTVGRWGVGEGSNAALDASLPKSGRNTFAVDAERRRMCVFRAYGDITELVANGLTSSRVNNKLLACYQAAVRAIWATLNIEVLRADEGDRGECGAARERKGGENGISPRKSASTNGIVRHDSHARKSGVTRPGTEPGSPWWEASRLTAQPPVVRCSDVTVFVLRASQQPAPVRQQRRGQRECVAPPARARSAWETNDDCSVAASVSPRGGIAIESKSRRAAILLRQLSAILDVIDLSPPTMLPLTLSLTLTPNTFDLKKP